MAMQDATSSAAPQPLLFATAELGSPAEALARFRELTTDICDVTVLGEPENFRVATATWHLGNAVLFESRSSALRYDRTPDHVARGIDHFQLSLHVAGGAEFSGSHGMSTQRPGDVCLIDMAKPSRTLVMTAEDGSAHLLTFMLPRMLLASLFGAQQAIPALAILPRETAFGRLIGEHMLMLHRLAPDFTQAESLAAIQSLVHLAVGGVADRAIAGEPVAAASQEAELARIKAHVENNLGAASLTVESLCAWFGLSRAGLYRLFAPDSPANYIQQRRLHRAFAMLISPAFRTWRLIDIALECQFSSDATFIRAFRRQFGLTPGEARILAGRKVAGAPLGKGSAALSPDAEAIRWVTELTGAMPHMRPGHG